MKAKAGNIPIPHNNKKKQTTAEEPESAQPDPDDANNRDMCFHFENSLSVLKKLFHNQISKFFRNKQAVSTFFSSKNNHDEHEKEINIFFLTSALLYVSIYFALYLIIFCFLF